MTRPTLDLAACGWSPFFQSQLDIDDLEQTSPVRVLAVHRGALDVVGPDVAGSILPMPADDDEDQPTVGDWLLLDRASGRPTRLLDRKSLFKRRAAGTARRLQQIAANVDTLFVVSSCNLDFNPARLERYLALAHSAEVTPVVVLTKADLTGDAADYAAKAARLAPGLLADCVDARDPVSVGRLAPWCDTGQTVALLGSSGVGKSTLVNTLTGTGVQATRAIRDDDDKGRHATTARSMHRLPMGGWLIDTPGMRELQVTDVEAGLNDVFADVVAVAARCRFSDCRHETEPGCAVRAAIADGSLDPDRWRRYAKLAAEDARTTETLAQRRRRDRTFGRMVKAIVKEKQSRQRGLAD